MFNPTVDVACAASRESEPSAGRLAPTLFYADGANRGRRIWLMVVRILGLAFVVLLLPIGFAGPASATTGSGTVIANPCVNLRSAPSKSAPVVGCIPYRTTVTIDCVATGDTQTGPYGATNLYDHISWNGRSGFSTDAWIWTGRASAAASPCIASPPPSSASGRSVGLKTVSNHGIGGQCTWGAYEMWRSATGYYPLLSGDAWQWAASARANGWTVVADAQPRSIVVFQRGVGGASSQTGHVAWVQSVQMRGAERWITIREMNWFYPGGWDTRTIKDIPGMSYILAP